MPVSERSQSVALVTEIGNLKSGESMESVLSRLAIIESMLGINVRSPNRAVNEITLPEEGTSDTELDGLLEATANLRRFTGPQNTNIWSPGVVKQLWLA